MGSTVKVLIVCLEICVLKFGHFRRERRVPLRSWDRMEPHGAEMRFREQPSKVARDRRFTNVSPTASHAPYTAMDEGDRVAKQLGTSTSATSEANKPARILG